MWLMGKEAKFRLDESVQKREEFLPDDLKFFCYDFILVMK